MKFTLVNGQIHISKKIKKLISFSEGCNSLTTRNLPASFWNSNYIYPVPAPTHPQVYLYTTKYFSLFFIVSSILICFSNFSLVHHFSLLNRFRTYIQPTVVIQRIHGFRMQLITVLMRMPPMRMQHKLMPIITIWHSMEVF